MAEYQRFIAYVYEYRKGKKESNCGFLKVEVRDHVCAVEIHLQVEGLTEGAICKIYGFVRKEGLMNGCLLGICKTKQNQIDCVLETDSMSMGASGIPLTKMGGMIMTTESGGFYGTEWDDQAIRPGNFRESPVETEVRDELAVENREKQDVSEPEQQTEEQQAEEQQIEEQQAEEPQIEEQQAEERPVEESEVSSDSQPIHIQSVQTGENNTSLPFGQSFCPFTDCDLDQCWKITPQDLIHFPRRQCALRNNRFLQYGYYNFGHLLLCRRQNGQYILGVPGCYDQQEQFMAGMFGFACFKESNLIKIKKGRGGYWYRTIDPPVCR